VEVRSTGVSVGYNLAATVFGGFAPAVLTFLTERAGTPMAPAWYVMGAAVVSLVALALAPAGEER
jgi:MHS family proline/betaine transporter-like MFS transporter